MKYIASTILTGIIIMALLNACDKVKPPYMNKVTIDTSSVKRVLCEEGTATSCTNCPKGICTLENMIAQYPNNFIPVAIHCFNDDPMYNTEFIYAINLFSNAGIPCASIDRRNKTDFPIDFAGVLSEYSAAISIPSPVDMSITNINWNSSSRVLTYTVQAKVINEFEGDYRFNSILTEDSVHGTSAVWNQDNSYAGTTTDMCGFESLTNPVPAAKMYYNHVARHISDGWSGASGSIPSDNDAGSLLTKPYSFTVPAGWNAANINIVGFIVNNSDSTIVNACQAVHVGK
jgi:hypothetical protein